MSESQDNSTIEYVVVDCVAHITLNRPEVLNAINREMRHDLTAAIDRAAADPDVRVVVVRGSGERAFSVGADIKEFDAPPSLAAERDERAAPKWTDRLAECPKPTIAAIHGFCLGGGLEIALACDIRIASADATLGLPEVRLGIIPGAGGTQRLPRTVGLSHALRLILSGERIDANRALRIGLVSDVVESVELDAEVVRITDELKRGAPRALAYAKQAIRRGTQMPIAEGLLLEADLSSLLLDTHDRLEGAAAFKERRDPVYTGS